MNEPNRLDDAVSTMLSELAGTEEEGPMHQVVLNACRVLRYLADRSVVTREEAGDWALGNWRPSDRDDHDLIEAALAQETGSNKSAAIDGNEAIFFGFRAEFIAKRGIDPKDQ
jgi:hypothetical protein